MWLTTALQIILIYELPCVRAAAWITGDTFNYSTTDFYFEILVNLSLNISNWHYNGYDYVNAGQGVLICRERILTSYTPFKMFLHNKTAWELLVPANTFGRKRFSEGDYESYLYTHKIVCARQVQFLPDEKNKNRLRHGTDRRHSPLHDLMVLRILGNLSFSTSKEEDYTPEKFPEGTKIKIKYTRL